MAFTQKTIIRNVNPIDVVRCFHSHKFIEFLTLGQPVKIESWKGIDNNKKASFSFWFFGWRRMSVVHENYILNREYLSFEDKGLVLPFGLQGWTHRHIVKPYESGALIIDQIHLEEKNILKKYFVYPLMLFPIIIRKITYRIWFNFLEGRLWTSTIRSSRNEV